MVIRVGLNRMLNKGPQYVYAFYDALLQSFSDKEIFQILKFGIMGVLKFSRDDCYGTTRARQSLDFKILKMLNIYFANNRAAFFTCIPKHALYQLHGEEWDDKDWPRLANFFFHNQLRKENIQNIWRAVLYHGLHKFSIINKEKTCIKINEIDVTVSKIEKFLASCNCHILTKLILSDQNENDTDLSHKINQLLNQLDVIDMSTRKRKHRHKNKLKNKRKHNNKNPKKHLKDGKTNKNRKKRNVSPRLTDQLNCNVIQRILDFCDVEDVCKFSATNKQIFGICNDLGHIVFEQLSMGN